MLVATYRTSNMATAPILILTARYTVANGRMTNSMEQGFSKMQWAQPGLCASRKDGKFPPGASAWAFRGHNGCAQRVRHPSQRLNAHLRPCTWVCCLHLHSLLEARRRQVFCPTTRVVVAPAYVPPSPVFLVVAAAN